MRWRKLGRVYVPDGTRWWARSHAHLPTPLVIDDKLVRVYFASLDEEMLGRVGFVELDPSNPTRVLRESAEPLLDLGALGAFDDSGVTPSCAVNWQGEERLYYIGWQRAERVPYMLFTGLARRVGDRFDRVARVPVLDRTDSEPFSRSAPHVIAPHADGAGEWVAWYWSCERWVRTGDQLHYYNVIRRATSGDGLTWVTCGEPVLRPPTAEDYAVGRPWQVADDALLVSIRGHRTPYRIAAARRSGDGQWEHAGTPAGLEVGGEAWESEMCCYPATVDVGGRRLLFYNGNGHGRTGFGVAVLESD